MISNLGVKHQRVKTGHISLVIHVLTYPSSCGLYYPWHGIQKGLKGTSDLEVFSENDAVGWAAGRASGL